MSSADTNQAIQSESLRIALEIIGEDEMTSLRELSREMSMDTALDISEYNLARNDLRKELIKAFEDRYGDG